ncbi:MAG: oxidoreductase, FAD-dependent [Subtercola sp.]|nr:oxidoreductase, FAD-dependent [Subtercola sp.]
MTPTTITQPIAILAEPGETSYADAVASFNLDAHLEPALAVVATTPGEVADAIREARERGLRVRTQSTGHAAKTASSMRGDALIRTRIAGPVVIDPDLKTAHIPAGTLWGAVVEAAAPYRLVAIHGSSPTVGAIGFLLRGGLSFYGRKFGVSANSVRSITITLASGVSVVTSDENQPELFWALRGGGGGFGVVTDIEVQLYDMYEVITGAAFWPAADAAVIAPLWRAWTETAPLEATTNLRVMNLPPVPGIPAVLTAGPVLVLDGAIAVAAAAEEDASQAILDALLNPLLEAAPPLMNTWTRALPSTLPQTHMDPREPIPGIGDHLLLTDLDDEALMHIITLAAQDTTLAVFELRQLGGRFAEPLRPGGAFDRTPAKFLYLGAGAIFSEDARVSIDTRLSVLREYLHRWDTGYTAPTFVENFGDPQRTLSDADGARVARIRLAMDPMGMFAGDVSPVRDTLTEG